jgi:F0F1-type ATP synthase membrane subunit b/b'
MNGFLVPDPVTVVIECLVFAVVLLILGRVALPRLRGVVDDQQRQLLEAERAATAAASHRERAIDEARSITQAARRQAREIIDRGQATHDRLVTDGRRKGREEYEWERGRVLREADRQASTTSSESVRTQGGRS